MQRSHSYASYRHVDSNKMAGCCHYNIRMADAGRLMLWKKNDPVLILCTWLIISEIRNGSGQFVTPRFGPLTVACYNMLHTSAWFDTWLHALPQEQGHSRLRSSCIRHWNTLLTRVWPWLSGASGVSSLFCSYSSYTSDIFVFNTKWGVVAFSKSKFCVWEIIPGGVEMTYGKFWLTCCHERPVENEMHLELVDVVYSFWAFSLLNFIKTRHLERLG